MSLHEEQRAPDDLVSAVIEALVARRLTIAVAESCTGGLICAMLCRPPGASRFLLGGVVAYANALKTGLLGLSAEELATRGAVSAATALAMARGMRTLAGSDLALGVSGLAGPQAGRRSRKPAGVVYVALVGGPRGDQERKYHWEGERDENMRASAAAALRLVRDELAFA